MPVFGKVFLSSASIYTLQVAEKISNVNAEDGLLDPRKNGFLEAVGIIAATGLADQLKDESDTVDE